MLGKGGGVRETNVTDFKDEGFSLYSESGVITELNRIFYLCWIILDDSLISLIDVDLSLRSVLF